MEKIIYVKLSERISTDYISINKVFMENDLQKQYENIIEIYDLYNIKDKPTLHEFENEHIKIKVEYDGRKRTIFDHDIIKVLEKEGYIKRVSNGGIFGGYYKKTDKLKIKKELAVERILIAV